MGIPLPEDDTAWSVEDLLVAARYGDLEDVKCITSHLSKNTQNDQGCTALHMAAANGHLDVVQYLIANGASVNMCNADKNTPLHWAALNGQIQIVHELISHGANASALNLYDRTPMDEAITHGNQNVLEALTAAVATAALNETTI